MTEATKELNEILSASLEPARGPKLACNPQ
jgi:hypothetical protein